MANPAVTLKDGIEIPFNLLKVYWEVLQSLLDAAGRASEDSMSYMLALYDATKIAEGKGLGYTGDCKDCFGGNRQKLLDSKLVEGSATGPLTMRPEVGSIVRNCLVFDPSQFSVRLVNPLGNGADITELLKEGIKVSAVEPF